ncbi:MAG: hypothetical protein M1827_003196 [Pycnora praestabilis]|nr:MAG: hypothetical protein M1827_003196 [Pycnora praestabilis]
MMFDSESLQSQCQMMNASQGAMSYIILLVAIFVFSMELIDLAGRAFKERTYRSLRPKARFILGTFEFTAVLASFITQCIAVSAIQSCGESPGMVTVVGLWSFQVLVQGLLVSCAATAWLNLWMNLWREAQDELHYAIDTVPVLVGDILRWLIRFWCGVLMDIFKSLQECVKNRKETSTDRDLELSSMKKLLNPTESEDEVEASKDGVEEHTSACDDTTKDD